MKLTIIELVLLACSYVEAGINNVSEELKSNINFGEVGIHAESDKYIDGNDEVSFFCVRISLSNLYSNILRLSRLDAIMLKAMAITFVLVVLLLMKS